MLNFCKPGSHIVIEIRPYSAAKVKRHKHGCTHLVRVYEREAYFADPARTGEDGVSTEAGKLRNIFEQEITSDPSNLHGVGRALRRAADSVAPPRPSRSKKRSRPPGGFGHGAEVGGGVGSDSNYREA